MNVSTMRDLGSYFIMAAEVGADGETITAAAGNDNTAVGGTAVDRLVAGRSLALSCKFGFFYKATLASGKTLSAALKLEQSLTGGSAFSTAATLPAFRARHVCGATVTGGGTAGTITALTLNSSGELAATVLTTGGSGGTVEIGCVEMDVDISAAGQYIRAKRTLDLSASGTDTVVVIPFMALCGAQVTPAT